MSWHFSFHAKTRDALGRGLEDESITGSQFPEAIRHAIKYAADEVYKSMPVSTGMPRMLAVTSGGHLDSWGGSATIEVKLVNVPLE